MVGRRALDAEILVRAQVRQYGLVNHRILIVYYTGLLFRLDLSTFH